MERSHILRGSLLRAKHWEESLWLKWARFTSQNDWRESGSSAEELKRWKVLLQLWFQWFWTPPRTWTGYILKTRFFGRTQSRLCTMRFRRSSFLKELVIGSCWRWSSRVQRNRNLSDLSKHSKHPMQAFTYQILQNLVLNIQTGIGCLLQYSPRNAYVYSV